MLTVLDVADNQVDEFADTSTGLIEQPDERPVTVILRGVHLRLDVLLRQQVLWKFVVTRGIVEFDPRHSLGCVSVGVWIQPLPETPDNVLVRIDGLVVVVLAVNPRDEVLHLRFSHFVKRLAFQVLGHDFQPGDVLQESGLAQPVENFVAFVLPDQFFVPSTDDIGLPDVLQRLVEPLLVVLRGHESHTLRAAKTVCNPSSVSTPSALLTEQSFYHSRGRQTGLGNVVLQSLRR